MRYIKKGTDPFILVYVSIKIVVVAREELMVCAVNVVSKILLLSIVLTMASCKVKEAEYKAVDCNQDFENLEISLINCQQNMSCRTAIQNKAKLLVDKCTNSASLRMFLANLEVSQGNNFIALAYATDAVYVEPNNTKAINFLGFVYSLLGQADNSLELLEKSLNLEPENIDFLVNYCTTLELFKRYKKAIKYCSKAIEKYDSPIAYYIRARAYESRGDKRKSQLDYSKAKQLGYEPMGYE